MAVLRWRFEDPATGESYTVPMNPKEMKSLWPDRPITVKGTTAAQGQGLAWEGNSTPVEWGFSGAALDYAHHEALRGWVYDHGRIYITDHFGRQITCVLKKFDATPDGKYKHRWRHTYEISGYVFAVGAPTVVA